MFLVVTSDREFGRIFSYPTRYPAHYGALIAFTGSLVGPSDLELRNAGSQTGTRELFSWGILILIYALNSISLVIEEGKPSRSH